ncbi:DUF2306 domain-containing protein [Hoeflea sp. CAU 1731]
MSVSLADYKADRNEPLKVVPLRSRLDAAYLWFNIAVLIASFGFVYVVRAIIGRYPFSLYRDFEWSFAYQAHTAIGLFVLLLLLFQPATGLLGQSRKFPRKLHKRFGMWVFALLMIYGITATVSFVYWNIYHPEPYNRGVYSTFGLIWAGGGATVFLIRAIMEIKRRNILEHKIDMMFACAIFSSVGLTRMVTFTLKTLGHDPFTTTYTLGFLPEDAITYMEMQTFVTSALFAVVWFVYAAFRGVLPTQRWKNAYCIVPFLVFSVVLAL